MSKAELLTFEKDAITYLRNYLKETVGVALAKRDGIYMTIDQRLIPSFAKAPFIQIHDPEIDFTESRGQQQLKPRVRFLIYTYQEFHKDDYALMGSPTGELGVLDITGKVLYALANLTMNDKWVPYIDRVTRSVALNDPTGSEMAFYQTQAIEFDYMAQIITAT